MDEAPTENFPATIIPLKLIITFTKADIGSVKANTKSEARNILVKSAEGKANVRTIPSNEAKPFIHIKYTEGHSKLTKSMKKAVSCVGERKAAESIFEDPFLPSTENLHPRHLNGHGE